MGDKIPGKKPDPVPRTNSEQKRAEAAAKAKELEAACSLLNRLSASRVAPEKNLREAMRNLVKKRDDFKPEHRVFYPTVSQKVLLKTVEDTLSTALFVVQRKNPNLKTSTLLREW